MAREISHTLILEGELVADSPIHVGGADTGHSSDLPLAIDGQDRYYLPGTSTAGAIRAWEMTVDDDAIWGHADKNDGQASFIIIDDAPAIDAPRAELWHGVGIDRCTGGAANGIKFDRQILPQGTRFRFRLQREVSSAQDLPEARARMGRLLLALEKGQIPFGAAQTRGFGRMHLERATGSEHGWSKKEEILAWLRGAQTDAIPQWRACAETSTHTETTQYHITIHWRPRGPLMSKSAYDGMDVDMLPFVSRARNGNYALTLPGSSIKGALRSHAERIIRTVLDNDCNAQSKQHFEQTDVPLVRELFGAARTPDRKDDGARKTTPPAARGLLAVETCYAEISLPDSDLEKISVDFAAWKPADTQVRKLHKADHVAIDRWTGGASDGALYNAIEPDRGLEWEPIRLHIDLRRGERYAERALLWLVLCDLAAGRIPLGFGVNRGYGDILIDHLELSGLDNAPPLTLSVRDGVIDIASEFRSEHEKMKQAWTEWIRQHTLEGAA